MLYLENSVDSLHIFCIYRWHKNQLYEKINKTRDCQFMDDLVNLWMLCHSLPVFIVGFYCWICDFKGFNSCVSLRLFLRKQKRFQGQRESGTRALLSITQRLKQIDGARGWSSLQFPELKQ